jgi:hypothetical protein
MKRKLMLLNLALLAFLVASGFEFDRRVEQAHSRYEILQRFDAAKQTPQFPAPQGPARVRQAEYLPIVDHLLFYQDRNAVVEVEAPEEKVVERPALPVLSGVVNFGEGPIALMADDSKSDPRPVKVGEKVGEYTFLGFAGNNLKLSWQSEEFEVSQDRLAAELESRPRAAGSRSAGPAAGGSSSPAARRAAASRRPTTRPEPSAQQAAADNRKTIGGRFNIGHEIRPGVFRADPKDTAPAGTEFEGYRKVVNPTPFGNQSWWVRKDAQQPAPK